MRVAARVLLVARKWCGLLFLVLFATVLTFVGQNCGTGPPGGKFTFSLSAVPAEQTWHLSGDGRTITISATIMKEDIRGTTWRCSLRVEDPTQWPIDSGVQQLDTSQMKTGYSVSFNLDASDWRRTGNYHAWGYLVPASQDTPKTADCPFGVIYDKDRDLDEVAWAGDRAVGAPGETLSEPRAYSLWAQSFHSDLNVGLNDIDVTWYWKPDSAGTLLVENPMSCSLQLYPGDSTVVGAFPYVQGLSHAWFVLSDSFAGRCSVVARLSLGDSGVARDSAIFEVGSSSEEYDSVLTGRRVHSGRWQNSLWTPYEGDGYAAGFGGDPDPSVKSILVEVDYDVNLPGVVFVIDSARRIVDSVFATAGVKCSLQLDQALTSVGKQNSLRLARGFMYGCRNASLKRNGYVHVVVGGSYWEPYILGVNVCHQEASEDFCVLQHLATTDWNDSCTNKWLDSTGIFVFQEAAFDTWPVESTWTRPRMLGVVLAHELGHAAGLCHPADTLDVRNVMAAQLDFVSIGWPKYDSFKPPNAATVNKMNTRALLGRDKLNVGWPKLPLSKGLRQ